MDKKRVSVVSDALSPHSYFPLWHKYYAKLFGAKNLYIVTYDGLSKEFRDFELGGVWEIPHRYDDNQRALTMSSLVKSLLTCSQVVLRVDVDEFAVVDPQKYKDLGDYIDKLTIPYVTARGMNVIQQPSDPRLDLDQQVLFKQRSLVNPVGPLNKTCLTTVGMDWGPGFHFTSHYPVFDGLFLFHMKMADFDLNMNWGGWMLEQVRGNQQFEDYYRPEAERFLSHQARMMTYPQYEGIDELYRDDFNRRFLRTFQYVGNTKIYHGDHVYEDVLIRLNTSFEGVF